MRQLTWRKSSRSSDPAIAACVEVADLGDGVAVRDSKDANSPVLSFTRAEWAGLLAEVKANF